MTRLRAKFSRFRLLSNNETAHGTEASKFINDIFEVSRSLSYLEIGVYEGRTIEAVKMETRVAVDPDPRFLPIFSKGVRTFRCTSDSFFLKNRSGNFDCIYLDGLHHFEQTWKDIESSTAIMKSKGFVLIDDVVPVDKYSAITPQSLAISERRKHTGSTSRAWHGDVFKLMVLFKSLPKNFVYGTICFRRNPKAFLICTDGNWSSFPKSDALNLSSIEAIDAESVFGFTPEPAIPSYFHPMSPESAKWVLKDFVNS